MNLNDIFLNVGFSQISDFVAKLEGQGIPHEDAVMTAQVLTGTGQFQSFGSLRERFPNVVTDLAELYRLYVQQLDAKSFFEILEEVQWADIRDTPFNAKAWVVNQVEKERETSPMSYTTALGRVIEHLECCYRDDTLSRTQRIAALQVARKLGDPQC